MRPFAVIPLLSALATLSTAQTVDPNSVPIGTRQQWCNSQITSCPLLCLQLPGNSATTISNNCDATTLAYSCVCENGQSPNASEYSQTVPYFECTEYGNQCVAACGNNNLCASNCRTQRPCGAQDPKRVNTSTISSTMSATATGSSPSGGAGSSAQYSGFGGAAATTAAGSSSSSSSSSSKSAAATAMSLGQSYGLAVVVAGFFAGFALVL